MTLPLIVLILVLVAYPAGYAVYLAMLNKGMTRFVGLGNFEFLLRRDTFRMIVYQSCLFTFTAVFFKVVIGFVIAHFVHNVPTRGQRKWRGMLLVPWVIPPALSTLAWRWLFDPSYSAFNWILEHLGLDRVSWLGETGWARFSVILANVWFGAPFFMIMYLASLKSVPEQLYEAAAIDGATWWQRIRYVTLPMMRNVIAITVLASLVGTFAAFDVVAVLTQGGPLRTTQVFATWAFNVGILSGDPRWAPACHCSCCRSWRWPRPSSCEASSGGGVKSEGRRHALVAGRTSEPSRDHRVPPLASVLKN